MSFLSVSLFLSPSCVSVCISFSFSSAEGGFPPSDEHGKSGLETAEETLSISGGGKNPREVLSLVRRGSHALSLAQSAQKGA